jgi:hypothetical protein
MYTAATSPQQAEGEAAKYGIALSRLYMEVPVKLSQIGHPPLVIRLQGNRLNDGDWFARSAVIDRDIVMQLPSKPRKFAVLLYSNS